MTKEQKIRQMLAMGKQPAEIAKKLDTTKQYVYSVKSKSCKAERKAIADEIRRQAEKASTPLWTRFIKWLRGE